jgi:hypothetical protein
MVTIAANEVRRVPVWPLIIAPLASLVYYRA